MTPTNEQIKAEARRRTTAVWGDALEDTIIEIMRENWTPPEPVDPDVLAFREWAIAVSMYSHNIPEIQRGELDKVTEAQAYLAGARMAREQERERGRVLVEFVEDHSRRLDGVGARAHDILAKYRGEAR